MGQVMLDDRAYLVRWEYSYSSWTLFTCEIEMLLHVVSTAGEEGREGRIAQLAASSRAGQLLAVEGVHGGAPGTWGE